MVDKITTLQVVLIAAAILYILLSVPELSERQEVDMYLTVGPYIGMNIDQTGIFFGTVPPGGEAERIITINNEDNWEKNVHFEASGNISSWVSLPGDSVIEANKRTNFTIHVSVPTDAEYGDYTGKLHLALKR